LFRPKGFTGKRPAVLCPHGHWGGGRFHDQGEKKVLENIVIGAERFEVGGRSPFQARCVQLARMGCVVFFYDMVGYADSVQLGHRDGVRPEMNTPENWGYFSPQAELHLQSIMGLQTYNSIRALDWLCELPDVDPQRIGVTGASGGGTQTLMLCALDPRPAVAFPAVMVSTAMQGGCVCENACYLRRGTGNVEIAALIAPRALGMTGADDWTKEIDTKGLPELKQIYKLFDAEKMVMAKPLVQFPHNYNYVSREVMYHWMNKRLALKLREPIIEEDFRPLSIAEMTVWDDEHPRPPSGDEFERSLLRSITETSNRQMQSLIPTDAASLKKFRQVVGGAFDAIIGRRVPAAGTIVAKSPAPGHILLRNTAADEELPAILLNSGKTKHVVIWLGKNGKSSLYEPGESQALREPVQRLLDRGVTVMGIDLFGQGDFVQDPDNKPMDKNRLNGHPHERSKQHHKEDDQWTAYAAFTYGYNDPLFAQRVHDILSAVSYARHSLKAERVDVVGLNGAGHWVAAARAQAGKAIDRAVIDTAGFRFAHLTTFDDADFLPGAVKYLDLPGMLALSAPYPLWLADAGQETPPIVTAAYRAAEATASLTTFTGKPEDSESAAIEWLMLQ